MKRVIGRFVLKSRGWTLEPGRPDTDKFVMLGAPHTTNWDLLYLLAMAWSSGTPMNWLGKEQLFVGPMNFVMRKLGGIPVARNKKTGMVESLAEEFRSSDRLGLTFPPAGTRSKSDHWKSGFYRVALAADVPIYCGFLDYGNKIGGFGRKVIPSGDMSADIEIFREFYAGKSGKYPDKQSDIRFRDIESSVDPASDTDTGAGSTNDGDTS